MKKHFYITENAFKDKNCPPKTEPSMMRHRNSNLNFTKFRIDLMVFIRFNYFSPNLEQI